MKPLNALINLLYPTVTCLACKDEAPLDKNDLCAVCARSLIESEPPIIAASGPLFGAAAAYPYEGAALGLIHALKYEGVRSAANVLGKRMAPLVEAEWEITALVPVPLHKRRERERGFNQAALIARAISLRTGIPLEAPIIRARYTKTQTKLDAKAREKNVSGAFISAACSGNLLLIDDVYTTGATLCACAEELLRNGAKRVYALTAAKV